MNAFFVCLFLNVCNTVARGNNNHPAKNTNKNLTTMNLTTYTMHNLATGKTITKTQKNEPKLAGFICTSSREVMPESRGGRRLFWDANNRPYYAAVNADGSHYQP